MSDGDVGWCGGVCGGVAEWVGAVAEYGRLCGGVSGIGGDGGEGGGGREEEREAAPGAEAAAAHREPAPGERTVAPDAVGAVEEVWAHHVPADGR